MEGREAVYVMHKLLEGASGAVARLGPSAVIGREIAAVGSVGASAVVAFQRALALVPARCRKFLAANATRFWGR